MTALAMSSAKGGLISIRGNPSVQMLPMPHTAGWATWTFDGTLSRVEDDREEGWVPCTTYDTLYLPADLPPPQAQPALGIVVTHGTLRYCMPSMILSLSTPDRAWRNRGLNSLPRAHAWIDLFSPLTPRLESLRLSAFGQSAADVRFLEDQDGAAAWESLFVSERRGAASALLPDPPSTLSVHDSFQRLKSYLQEHLDSPLHQGYHFVDIAIPSAASLRLPMRRMKMYLTDIDGPRRLLEYTDSLDEEPLGELSLEMARVEAGGDSEFLPDVYRDLYEPGSILMDI